jgi:hypothetical protein
LNIFALLPRVSLRFTLGFMLPPAPAGWLNGSINSTPEQRDSKHGNVPHFPQFERRLRNAQILNCPFPIS